MRAANVLALILVIVGAVNWLLVGLLGFDLVAWLFAAGFGTLSTLSRVVYVLVGLAGVWLLFTLLPRESTGRAWDEAHGMAT
ncbi:MAG TPA: DUF378 domain-containing protein [Armatimonadota bacterium]|nr:DUF378 domain-containing protein [Armatimonadota bacterium]HOS43301.1 DUF378 domain-containing protein [Armatimonadota bacterium]